MIPEPSDRGVVLWAPPLTPSPRYSGERVGERGGRRPTSRTARFADQRDPGDRPFTDSTRNRPLSPALSPEYQGEGVRAPSVLRRSVPRFAEVARGDRPPLFGQEF